VLGCLLVSHLCYLYCPGCICDCINSASILIQNVHRTILKKNHNRLSNSQLLEGPPSSSPTIKLGDIEGHERVFYQVSTFHLLCANQGFASTGLCYVSPIVWTFVCENNYTQRNMCGRGSNLRPSDSDRLPPPPLCLKL
jgi:hypothetical protein